MLNVLKLIAKQVLSRKYLLFAGQIFRSILFQFYRGGKYQCPVCDKKLRKFMLLSNGEKRCPNCGSLGNDRRLWLVLRPFLRDYVHILHFSPSLCLFRKLRRYPGIIYNASEVKGKFPSEKHLDLTSLEEPSVSFDLLICYYVLDHIEDDKKAMQELNRVLRVGGKCFIQSPFKQGMIYEAWDKNTPEVRRKLFGKKTRVRTYSVDGLKARLQNTGFEVVATKFVEANDNYYGLKEEEYVVTAMKY